MNDEPMDVVVTAKKLELPDELRDSAAKKTVRLARYADVERAEVTFSNTPAGRLGDPITCEIVLELRGRVVRSVGTGGRPANALDDALEKSALQLSRIKRKLVGRSRPRHGEGSRAALPTTVPGPDEGGGAEDVVAFDASAGELDEAPTADADRTAPL